MCHRVRGAPLCHGPQERLHRHPVHEAVWFRGPLSTRGTSPHVWQRWRPGAVEQFLMIRARTRAPYRPPRLPPCPRRVSRHFGTGPVADQRPGAVAAPERAPWPGVRPPLDRDVPAVHVGGLLVRGASFADVSGLPGGPSSPRPWSHLTEKRGRRSAVELTGVRAAGGARPGGGALDPPGGSRP